MESESREVGKSLKIGKNRIKSEKSDANLLIFGAIVLIFGAKFELVQFYQFLVPFY